MAGETEKRLFPDKAEVKMRLYGQGLGDCFLLAFPRRGEPKNPCYLVIDCGAAMSTPDKDLRIKKVVEDIHAATGGHIDALAITHQHFDHISGFQDAWQEWKKISVDTLYLPWTESTAEEGEHKSASAFREVLDRAAKKALERAVKEDVLDAQPGFRAQADFLGVSLPAAGGGSMEHPANMDEAMVFARGLCPPDKIRYFEPGDVFRLPGTDFHGYVLGPPMPDKKNEKGKKYIELLVDEDEKVMYSYGPLGLKVDSGKPGGANAFALSDDHSLPALASGLLAVGTLDRDGDEGFCPFAPAIRLDWDQAMASPFFQKHYGDSKGQIENGEWRRVDLDWLAGSATLALRAGDYTNNVSLVLAFDMPGSEKMLLFPGDAQVGNWLSWHTIDSWRYRDASMPAKPPAANDRETLMENLLSRVAFYKVGHHGSHNATIKDQGLEAMTREDLVAYLPVSVPVAQDLMGYCPMPFYPVVRALQSRTKGRVFLPTGNAVGKLPEGKKDKDLLDESGIRCSEEILPPKMKDGKVLEDQVPLYLEMTVAR
ncbi:MAG TPA: MBL fold metallo-hydrolase [Thermoanaerobaculia bacterium]|nr:MBL fold metallo-hydrolase [Thermoanaerobaculia bacterium]